MVISLFGLITIQALWIKYAIESEEAKFDQLVYDAMQTALSNVERKNVYEFIDQEIELPEPNVDVAVSIELDELKDALVELEDLKEVENMKWHSFDDSDHVVHFFDDSSKSKNHLVIKTPKIEYEGDQVILFKEPGKYTYRSEDSVIYDFYNNGEYATWINMTDSIEQIIRIRENELLVKKEEVVKHKIEAFNENIEKWVHEYRFDNTIYHLENKIPGYKDAIKEALSNIGINLKFDYQVIQEDDTIISLFSSDKSKVILPDYYKTKVYPSEIFAKNIFLLLDFPGKKSHIYGKVYVIVIWSLIFTIIILITFGTTLYYIQKQKKLSEVKSDFINNMTHEFKTPIATIRLASDAMESPKVLGIEKPTKYYLNIIRQENKRMNNQVERVLQMALIDQGQLKIDIQNNDVHSIIQNCINVVELSVQKKNGTVSASLRASCHEIDIDEVHFANVINNLLDNAIKYTDREPDILIETYNKQDYLFVRISDNGIGMTKEVQKHIFDKFYRRPTGNIHNIKGFGLGLSYVKAIIDAHKGEISVTSEPGNGSTFLLKFNCSKNTDA